jgi:hypothetical protein
MSTVPTIKPYFLTCLLSLDIGIIIHAIISFATPLSQVDGHLSFMF